MEFLKRFWKLIGLGIAVLVFLFLFRGCNWSPFNFIKGSTKINGGPGKIEIEPNKVKYQPEPSKENPKPTPIEAWKPKEGKVEVTTKPDGKVEIKIQRFGLCFEPKFGFGAGEEKENGNDILKFYPMAGLRFLFLDRWGAEAMASEKFIHIGIDFRVGNLSASIGARQHYSSVFDFQTIGAYAGASFFIF